MNFLLRSLALLLWSVDNFDAFEQRANKILPIYAVPRQSEVGWKKPCGHLGRPALRGRVDVPARGCHCGPLVWVALGVPRWRRWGSTLAFYVETVVKFLMQLSH